MALDREKAFKEAERLLRVGRFDAALVELRRLSEDAPRDVLSLNRAGDLLAKFGRPGEALAYYDRVADQYAASGFFPKAVAILKKSQKLDPDRAETFARLGDLYLRQKLTGEARTQLLHAAERFLRSRRYGDARLVYERLVAAEPGDPRHRVRLAETRAAEGDTARAVDEFLGIGASLLASGAAEDAERAYRRAAELAPARPEPLVGLAAALGAGHRQAEAIDLVRGALPRFQPRGPLLGELLLLLVRAGRTDEARELLQGPQAAEIPDPSLERLLEVQLGVDRAEAAWELLDPMLAAWRKERRGIRMMGLLERLSRLEPKGHLPALERLAGLHREPGREADLAQTLPRLAQALRARGREEEARAIEAELPAQPGTAPPPPPPPQPPAASAPTPAPAAAPAAPAAGMRFPPEAPAVPLTPLEEEFVAGQLTEAEVLQNYGLAKESADRLRAVVERFPGHVQAQTKLADLLRGEGERLALKDVLVELALARRAAGDERGARRAAEEAARMGPFPEPVKGVLVRLRLLEAPAPARPPQSQPPAPPRAPAAPVKAKAKPRTEDEPVPAPAPAPAPSEDADMEIVFDEDAPAAEPRGRAPRRPQPDVLEEIVFFVDQGMLAEAGQRVAALRTLGYGGQELDALEARASQETPAATPSGARLDEEALRSLTQSLDGPMAAEPGVLDAEAAEEQSLADVFAAFKRQVEVEVGGEDYRTHYDLGIAYKEMGLLDDALEAFRTASGSPQLFREASSMAAMVHVEKGELQAAAAAYRQALETPGPGSLDEQALRYALAEVLLQVGDAEEARALLRGIVAADPGYRDASARLAELEAHRRG